MHVLFYTELKSSLAIYTAGLVAPILTQYTHWCLAAIACQEVLRTVLLFAVNTLFDAIPCKSPYICITQVLFTDFTNKLFEELRHAGFTANMPTAQYCKRMGVGSGDVPSTVITSYCIVKRTPAFTAS